MTVDGTAGSDAAAPVQITVFNQTYRVVSADGAERATLVARLVDERMRLVASQMTTHDVAKIAVMAALNIADDLLSLREAYEQVGERVDAPVEAAGETVGGGGEETHAPARISWYDSVFDEGFGSPQGRVGRMSSRISERLQAARQSDDEPAEKGASDD